ncbi:MAG: FAD-binding protein, partial [Candidatus Manganitrophaceae bacterium]
YHPDAELAPRDVVTRAIWDEMKHGKLQNVFLDVTHLKPGFLKERFPMIYATCLQYGVDITQDQIPVAPSAHYLMGGIKTGLFGETSLPGLWAVGEAACTGVHGANRLASNSLLEGLVFGMRVGQAVGRSSLSPAEGEKVGLPRLSRPAPAERYLLVQKELREKMWNNVGIIRSETSLSEAIARWTSWSWVLKKPGLSRLALETRNMLLASAAMMEAALRRKESIGAHYREDFPSSGTNPSPDHIRLTRTSLRKHFTSI